MSVTGLHLGVSWQCQWHIYAPVSIMSTPREPQWEVPVTVEQQGGGMSWIGWAMPSPSMPMANQYKMCGNLYCQSQGTCLETSHEVALLKCLVYFVLGVWEKYHVTSCEVAPWVFSPICFGSVGKNHVTSWELLSLQCLFWVGDTSDWNSKIK